ncbi:uncharacterized protein BJ171DRAFT_520663 [Polychytrium aggregatum]|uniref:uncharacterized protein n=1 Tax=Polychytrium aggregatum TaxID=110093 RepID=UPI0022FF3C98|nr:uncharacterized protein BJ171DRAFT_520663 [Polychytrium aggregatum]KAI9197302.1 hypothetical protein BJ171DRAFT_520663 [Polychytrium aggregatum]
MDTLGVEDLFRVVCETIPKNRRFSGLAESDLHDLWKALSQLIEVQLRSKRSVNCPGLGCFYVKRVKQISGDETGVCLPQFFPSKNWERIPGYQSSRSSTNGPTVSEPLNFSALTQYCSYPRDELEAGVKDIVHALHRVLKRGTNVVLAMGSFGKLYFQNPEIRLRFYPGFVKSLSDMVKPVTEPVAEHILPLDSPLPSNPVAVDPIPSPIESVESAPSSSSITLPPLPALHQAEPQFTEDDPEDLSERDLDTEESSVAGTPPPKLSKTKADENDPTYPYGYRVVGTHTHPHSGDRLWTNVKCPICRQRNMPVIDVKEQLVRREKDHDRLLLHLSLEVDREFMKKTKELELDKLKTAIATAQYNHTKAMDKEAQRKSINLPMGNLFENRPPPPDRILQNQQLSEGLHEQIVSKQIKRTQEKLQKEYEDRVLNQKFLREFKTSETEAHLEKLKRRQAQQDALSEQIRTAQERRKQITGAETDNPFARSESLMFLYQKEKAKQLYQEQLAIIKQKREYEARVADIERKNALERLCLSRKELEKDLQSLKKSNFQTRKSLESYWTEQIKLKSVTGMGTGLGLDLGWD